MSGRSEDDMLTSTLVKLPLGYSTRLEEVLEGHFYGWGKLLHIVKHQLMLHGVIKSFVLFSIAFNLQAYLDLTLIQACRLFSGSMLGNRMFPFK